MAGWRVGDRRDTRVSDLPLCPPQPTRCQRCSTWLGGGAERWCCCYCSTRLFYFYADLTWSILFTTAVQLPPCNRRPHHHSRDPANHTPGMLPDKHWQHSCSHGVRRVDRDRRHRLDPMPRGLPHDDWLLGNRGVCTLCQMQPQGVYLYFIAGYFPRRFVGIGLFYPRAVTRACCDGAHHHRERCFLLKQVSRCHCIPFIAGACRRSPRDLTSIMWHVD